MKYQAAALNWLLILFKIGVLQKNIILLGFDILYFRTLCGCIFSHKSDFQLDFIRRAVQERVLWRLQHPEIMTKKCDFQNCRTNYRRPMM